MTELSARSERVKRSLNETAKKLNAITNTKGLPINSAPPYYQSATRYNNFPKEHLMGSVSVEDYEKLVEVYEQKERVVKEMKEVIKEYIAKVKELEDKTLRLDEEKEELVSELKNAGVLSVQIEESKRKIQYLVTELEDERNKCQNSLKELKEKKKRLKDNIRTKDTTIDNLKLELEYAKKIAETRVNDIAEIKVKLRTLETNNEKLKTSLIDRENQVAKLEKSMVNLHIKSDRTN